MNNHFRTLFATKPTVTGQGIIQSIDNDSVENKSLKLKAIATCNDIYRYDTESMLDTRHLKEVVNFMNEKEMN